MFTSKLLNKRTLNFITCFLLFIKKTCDLKMIGTVRIPSSVDEPALYKYKLLGRLFCGHRCDEMLKYVARIV